MQSRVEVRNIWLLVLASIKMLVIGNQLFVSAADASDSRSEA